MLKSMIVLLVTCNTFLAGVARASESESMLIGVSDPVRAEYHWVMKCRGCHGVDARGSENGAPDMVGIVSQFLHSEEGRAFLGRVPGVAFVDLPDQDVAELLNWLTQTFDRQHVPANFRPYTAQEVSRLRQDPLISKAFSTRAEILQQLRSSAAGAPNSGS